MLLEWYKDSRDCCEGFIAVMNNDGKWNFFNTSGALLLDEWYDYVGDFCKGFAVVRKGNKNNIVNKDGKLISKRWFEAVWGSFVGEYVIVSYEGEYYQLDRSGNLLPL